MFDLINCMPRIKRPQIIRIQGDIEIYTQRDMSLFFMAKST